MNLTQLKSEWFGNVKNDILSGTVVALALIPEAIAFSIIAGVDPKVGLYASFIIAVTIAFFGGRTGMISAATGAMALVMVTLVKDYGLEYLFAATILTGIIQMIAGFFKLGSLLRFVSKSVVTGFVNALAILIFMAQLPEFNGASWQVYAMVIAGLGIIYGLPYLTKSVPSALVAIVSLTILSIIMDLDIRTVGDMGELPNSFPIFSLPNIPFTLETLKIILPYSITLAAVGLLESLMTAVIVDEFTDTSSKKNRECVGQGVANFINGFFGGMAGCAMIGQSVVNVKSGGRGRLSTFFAGAFLLFLILVLTDYVKQIPMAALVSVMIMVSIGTFNWQSITNARIQPKTSSLVMVTTVAIVVWTHNLALGVFVGVLMSALFFANRIAKYFSVESYLSNHNKTRIYEVNGQVFFASADNFIQKFDFKENIEHIIIDLSLAHLWDLTSVSALDKIVLKFRKLGKKIEIVGMNQASETLVEKLGIHDKSNAAQLLHLH